MKRLLLLFLSVWAMSSCGGSKPAGGPCKATRDCSRGLICAGGHCSSCAANAQCEADFGAGATCTAGHCLANACPQGTLSCPCAAGACTEGECVNDTCTDCVRGTEACVCFDNGSCGPGLRCNASAQCETCPLGELDCPCDSGGTCNDGLLCSGDVCAVDPCPKGTPDCPCRSDKSCDAPLFCLGNGVCTACSNDIEGCPCDGALACTNSLVCDGPTSTCRQALTCLDVTCSAHQLCEEAPGVDATCLSTCDPGWAWNSDTSVCDEIVPNCDPGVPGSRLAECDAAGRTCVAGPGTADCGACKDYYLDVGAFDCRAVSTCESLDCAGQNRECTSETPTSDAACGACLPNFVDDGLGGCAPVYNCTAAEPNSILATCDALHRSCNDPPTGPEDCGGCLAGYAENSAGECTPVGSCAATDLDCAGKNRLCEGSPPFEVCGPCFEGTSPDVLDNSRCLPPLTCSDLADVGTCDATQFCVEGTPYDDATCVDPSCPSGQAWSNWAGSCVNCVVSCDVSHEGETGRIWPYTIDTTNICICETQPGYYWDEGKRATLPCDADGDGWVRESARTYLETSEPAQRENARCNLHTIDRFVLQNEYEQRLNVFLCDSAPQLTWDRTQCTSPKALPLYETERNDDQSKLDLDPTAPAYQQGGFGRRFLAAEVNSLTRACIGLGADYNDNDVSDMSEWHGMTPASFSADQLLLANFSYYMELYRGFFERGTESILHGQYVIKERSRCDSTFPLTYGAGAADYWRQCTRSRDAAYDPSDGPTNPDFGMDFARWSCDANFGSCPIPPPPTDFVPIEGTGIVPPHGLCEVPLPPLDDECINPSPTSPWRCVKGGVWRGMSHHSQFRCVMLSSSPSTTTPVLAPSLVGSGAYVVNQCQVACPPGDPACTADCSGGSCATSSLVANGDNPASPLLSCAVATSPTEGTVGMVAASYASPSGGAYQHGCIDEWAPTSSTQPTADPVISSWRRLCPGWANDPVGVIGQGNQLDFGAIQCGCGNNYGGLDCDIGCPDTELHLDQGYQLTPRLGYWMCGGFSGTAYTDIDPVEGPALVGDAGAAGIFVLRGEVPASANDGTPLCEDPSCSTGFVLRPAPKP